jgi:hypothetical protein
MKRSEQTIESRRARVHEIVVACIGCALLLAAAAANQAWLDEHFLPSFFTPREELLETALHVRLAVAAVGIIVAVFLRRRIARAVAKEPLYLLTISIAIALAAGTVEMVLRARHIRAAEEIPPQFEPRRHLDARLGWLFDAPHVGYDRHLGRRYEYAFDRNGYRVPSPADTTDFDDPAIVFSGESMMVGEKLDWEETIPAETSARLGVGCANIAVSGFATDQQYLRLQTELPRFRHPLAVVALFTPSVFDRNLDDDRPHLEPGLVWKPAAKQWRLTMLVRRLIGYRSHDAIENGIRTTREALAAMVQLARSRGAVPLIVVPHFGAESPRERELRRRILDEGHLPYVSVALNPDDRIENDGHPDGDGDRAIAEAVAKALRPACGEKILC